MLSVTIWPTSDAGSWIPAGRAIVNGVPLTPTVIDPGPTARTGAWIVTEVVCPTTCIGPAFNCRAEVTVAVVFTIIPLIGLWSTTEASARPVWTATRLRSPARNVGAPAHAHARPHAGMHTGAHGVDGTALGGDRQRP